MSETSLFKVVFPNPLWHRTLAVVGPSPRRVFYIRAFTMGEAFEMAKVLEEMSERPVVTRARTLDAAIITALTRDEDAR
jgi:hypothetical protein